MDPSESSGFAKQCVAAAVSAARWIESVGEYRTDFTLWRPAPALHTSSTSDCSLYYGSSGIVLLLLDLYRATRQVTHLELARRAATGIVACCNSRSDALFWRAPWRPELEHSGLYLGASGLAVAFVELYRLTGEESYANTAKQFARAIVQTAVSERRWNGANDIIAGAAGVGLFGLWARDALLEELAIAAGDHLLLEAVRETSGCWWPELCDGTRRAQRFPNFSHGTAGIAYFLAQLYRRTGAQVYLDAAMAGASWLLACRQSTGRGSAWHHHDPGGESIYYLGWCHGPAGTARLFYALYLITDDSRWLDLVKDCAEWLEDRLFDETHPGLWNFGMCCGVAGIGDFFASLYETNRDVHYREIAEAAAAHLIEAASQTAEGLMWLQAEHRARPNHVLAQTGYAQGAAGIALFLLRMGTLDSLAIKGRCSLPDDPFGRL